MDPVNRFKRASRFVRRDAAERYLFITLLSFSGSVSLTRLYLSLAGYPQIGGGELHIAHVLWGGLLLFAAALVPLILANRWVYPTSAVLAGLGVGLFIDEVGKFITQKNDYFYPAAAPIIYTFFLLTILLYLHVRRMPNTSTHAELQRALGDIRQLLENPLQSERHARLESALDSIARNSAVERDADLARSLLEYVRAHKIPAAAPEGRAVRIRKQVLRPLEVIGASRQFCILLAIGLLAISLLNLKNPASILLSGWMPAGINNILGLVSGRHIEAAAAPSLFVVRVALELVVGSLLAASAVLLLSRRASQGSALGSVALLLSLTTVNLLLFYFEQFSTIITTTVQFILLMGLFYYRRSMAKT